MSKSVTLTKDIWIAGTKQSSGATVSVSDSLAGELVHAGSATYVSDPMSGERTADANFSTDASGNVTGLVGPQGGVVKNLGLFSPKMRAFMRAFTNSLPTALLIQGDSTGNNTDEWAYLLASALANEHPSHTHDYFLWNDTSQQYDQPVRMETGTAGAAHILTGSAETSWTLQIADSAATSPAGDMDVRVKLNLNGSAFSAQGAIASKFGVAGNRTWRLEMLTAGKMYFETSADGTTLIGHTSTAALSGSQLTSDIWVRATIDVDNGTGGHDVIFYTSTNGSTWTQLGSTVTTAGTTSLYNSTSTTQFIGRGTSSMAQQDHAIKFFEFEVYGSLDGTSRVIDVDVGAMFNRSNVTSNTFVDDVGNTVTVAYNDNGSLVGAPRFAMFNCSVSGAQISYSTDPTRYAKQSIGYPKACIISYSHNQTTDVEFRTDYKALTDLLLATNPDMHIIAQTQNARGAAGGYVQEHAIRCQQIAEFSAAQGFDCIDVFNGWDASAYTDTDGIHPTAAGKALWAYIVQRHFGVSV